MTVLSVTKDVCPVIGLDIPDILFASTEREHIELQALANEMARRIADETDWQRLRKIATITGDGSAVAFALPSDYARMVKKAGLWSTSQPSLALRHVTDIDRWLEDEISGFTGMVGEWTIYGGQLHIRPVMASGDIVKFAYVSKHHVSGDQRIFTADDQEFLLDERLLSLGMIWQWKANKGQPYQEDMENFNNAMSVAIGNDKGSRILTIGSGRIRGGAEFAFPHVVTP